MRHFLVPELICYKPRQNNFTFKNSASFIRLVDNVSVCKVFFFVILENSDNKVSFYIKIFYICSLSHHV